MKRVYVIIKKEDIMKLDWNELPEFEILDIVSSLDRAEDICREEEANNPGYFYYWREVISSED